MVGFEAIAHYNGWSMAIAGASIVLSGLAILSFIISQLHKLIKVLEKRDKESPPPTAVLAPKSVVRAPEHCPMDLNELALLYKPMAAELGDQFNLSDLYALANSYQFPHPHLTLRCLRESGKLIPLGEGKFRFSD
ncbi:MAG: OadG family protein [Desulfobacterales bacterium]